MNTAPGAQSGRVRLGVGAVIVLALAALALTVVIGIVRGAGGAAPVPVASASVFSAPSADVYVHVSGAVVEPGLYVLPEGSRVADAVTAAGGLADTADAAAVNLARAVTDGEQLVVPRVGEAPAQPVPQPGVRSDGKIDLNTADLAQLDELPRVGPAIAQRILDWREANGRFESVDDLLSVPGIGDKMLASLRELVTV